MRSRCIFLIYFISIGGALGQAVELPIATTTQKSSPANARTTEITLSLPFWDDFYENEGVPSDSLWQNSGDVLVNSYYAYLPPTGGVATFDGLKQDGSPYSNDPESSERTDRLTSSYIDLSVHAPSDNIFLSFFYQFGGYGEAPDVIDNDRLILEFKNESGSWQQVLVIMPQENQDPKEFYQVLVPVNDASYFHDTFQFSLQSYGNQSGPYDVWNVDYVYMNTNRSSTDEFYPDRAVNRQLGSIFKGYYAIPRAHIDFEKDYQPPYYLMNNLNNVFQTYRQKVSITVIEEGNPTTVEYPQTQEGTNSPIFPGERDTVTVPFPIMEGGFPSVDSTVSRIDYEIAVNTFDNRIDSGNYDLKYAPIDFRINDTIRQSFVLDDYYAYDDGSAEAALSLNIAGNKLAYEFTLRNVDSTFIYGIDMNTVYSGGSALGKPIDLHVWDNNDGKPGNQLYRQQFVLTGDNSRTSFSRYEFQRPVLVKDTFFIGFTVINSGRTPIGLDKNSSNSDKLQENIDGEWFPVGDRITGFLMMRPFIGPKPDETITGVEEQLKHDLQIYPNPSADGRFIIKGKADVLKVLDITGREIAFELYEGGSDTELFIPGRGLFVLHILTQGRVYYRKVIVK